MTPQSASAGRARNVGRGPRVRAAVLAATLAELTETGYAALPPDAIAHRDRHTRHWEDLLPFMPDR